MVRATWQPPPLAKDRERDAFMLTLEDDTEDASWMVMGDLQFWSASGFAHSLRGYAHERGLDWYVASMMPITYLWPGSKRKRQLAPDAFVAFVPEHSRSSFDVATEGGFPPFVLEVVSPSSSERDEDDKRIAYEALGAREYALFTPRDESPSRLSGYRRGDSGSFERWRPDDQGRLWSDVLGLYLVVRGTLLQAQTAEGRLLLTPDQTGAALLQAEEARRQEEEARRLEAEARRQAEAEVEQLRRELEQLRGQGDR
jgi:hypothetical protein